MKKILCTALIAIMMIGLLPNALAADLSYSLSPASVNLNTSGSGSFTITVQPDKSYSGVNCYLNLPSSVQITNVTCNYDVGFPGAPIKGQDGLTRFGMVSLGNYYQNPMTFTVAVYYTGAPLVEIPVSVILMRARDGGYGTDEIAVPPSDGNMVALVPNPDGVIKSSNADLSSLAVGSYALTPGFAPATTSYSAVVPAGVTSVAVNATAASAYAKVEVSGNNPLGSSIAVKVTAEDGVTVKTYTVAITSGPSEPGGPGDPGNPGNPGGPGGSGDPGGQGGQGGQSGQDGGTEVGDGDTPLAQGFPFTDVKVGDWFYGDVYYMWENSLMNGTSDTLFSPGGLVTRGMVVTVLYRMEGRPDVSELANPFGDVAEGLYYTDAVKWAADNKIILGYGDGKFGPSDNVTREQLAAILYRYQQYAENIAPETATAQEFADAGSISGYAKEFVDKLVMQGIINGRPNNLFDPQGNATRAEYAAILHRYLVAVAADGE